MEKTKKLRRYSRKDYSQLVDFPVEIVGRDGVIRRYSFESSVRLYQRRIASAPSRYDDSEVVNAEVRHCRRRIEQLRKSYFHRYGWSSIRAEDGPGGLAGEFAGEVAAFLRRVHGDESEPERLEVTWVQDDASAQVYFVALEGDRPNHLLYLYRFRDQGPCEGRDAFFRFLRMLRSVRGEGVEALVAFHHTADCGLILTGSGGSAVAPPNPEAEGDLEAAWLGAAMPDPLTEGMQLLSTGDPEAALARLEPKLSESPFRRDLAVAVAVVADAVGRPELSELAARLGVHHAPNDPVFHHHLGLARLRMGDLEGARVGLTAALAESEGLPAASLLLGLIELREGRFFAARRSLRAALSRSTDPEVQRAARTYLTRARLSLSAGIAGMALFLVALAAWGTQSAGLATLAAGLGAGMLTLAAGSRAWTRGKLDAVWFSRLRLAPPEAVGGRSRAFDELV
ncbi:MAG: hypothetical protein H6741_15575 [Alphaproteobacteria bacterium]|nr:hypothetical protein [Alphaproteobacteria bacterium]MCB9794134.1 hypothetical protein [Alphaproteobacteria bacterium]